MQFLTSLESHRRSMWSPWPEICRGHYLGAVKLGEHGIGSSKAKHPRPCSLSGFSEKSEREDRIVYDRVKASGEEQASPTERHQICSAASEQAVKTQ